MSEAEISDTSVLYDVQNPEFYYSAALQIGGESLDLDGITRQLGLQPTHQHRKGQRPGPRSPLYKVGQWRYEAPVAETEHLSVHLMVLWQAIRSHKEYLMRLKEVCDVEVFCGFRTNCQITGVVLDHGRLEIFSELEIPFGLSITLI